MPATIHRPGSGVLGVIPARFHSTRFPGKVIHPILGRPMVQYVWEAAKTSQRLTHVCIATEDESVRAAARQFGAECLLTPDNLASGGDRVAWIARDRPEDVVVNLQADEPLITSESIDALVSGLTEGVDISTLVVPKAVDEDFARPHVVKAVCDGAGKALYFSRKPLTMAEGQYLKHIGIYAYRRNALLKLCALPPSPLELHEKLEQLRALENNFTIRVVSIPTDTVAVDVPEDVKRVEQKMQSLKRRNEGLV